jgi:hypothetical protein
VIYAGGKGTTFSRAVKSFRFAGVLAPEVSSLRPNLFFYTLLGAFWIVCCLAHAQSAPSAQSSTPLPIDSPIDLALQSSVYVKVQLANTMKVSALKPGDVIAGKLAQDIYSGDRQLFHAASVVHLTVDKLGRRRRVANDHWPWVIKVFTPRHENYPTFLSGTVSLIDGREVPLRVSLISINRETEIRARRKARTDAGPTVSSKLLGSIVTLQAANPRETLATSGAASGATSAAPSSESPSDNTLAGPATLSAGTLAKVILLSGVSASQSRPGDSFQARLIEPVILNSKIVLPEGTILGGKVVNRTPPRMLSRAGSILLVFTDLTLPGKAAIPLAASVTGADVDQRSHTRIDPEGKLHGDRPGKVWMAINLGVTGGIAKEADDTIQLIVEGIVSTASDASTAGVGRIIAACASGLFLITRHGRDVVLPRFTQMNLVFDRPLSLAGSQPASSVP